VLLNPKTGKPLAYSELPLANLFGIVCTGTSTTVVTSTLAGVLGFCTARGIVRRMGPQAISGVAEEPYPGNRARILEPGSQSRYPPHQSRNA